MAQAKEPTVTESGMPARIRELAILRGLGYSFSEIGHLFGITAQAVSLMLVRYRKARAAEKSAPELRGLSARAVKVLARRNIRCRQDARDRLDLARLPQDRNCGKKTLEELKRWVEAKPARENFSASALHVFGSELPPAVAEAAVLRGLGFSVQIVAERLQTTPAAISSMLQTHRRELPRVQTGNSASPLSSRAANALGRHCIRSREQASSSNVLQALAKDGNCGRKTLEEIARWIESERNEPAVRPWINLPTVPQPRGKIVRLQDRAQH